MSATRWDGLYPATRASIELAGLPPSDVAERTVVVWWPCGCDQKGDMVTLCQYHQGFEDGVEAGIEAESNAYWGRS